MAVFPIEVAGAKSTIGTYKKVSADRKQTNSTVDVYSLVTAGLWENPL